jgi:hypothetical protein
MNFLRIAIEIKRNLTRRIQELAEGLTNFFCGSLWRLREILGE